MYIEETITADFLKLIIEINQSAKAFKFKRNNEKLLTVMMFIFAVLAYLVVIRFETRWNWAADCVQVWTWLIIDWIAKSLQTPAI